MSHEQPTTRPRFLDRIKAPDFQAVAAQGCFVYCYLRKETGTPYYVGIASRARRPVEITHSVVVPRDRPRIRVMRAGLTWEAACRWECRYIARYGRKDIGTGVLRNRTDGGEGTANPSEVTRMKIGDKHKGKVLSEQTREKLRAANLGKKQSSETIIKRTAGQKGRKMPPKSSETLRRMSEAQLGKKRGPEPHKGPSISQGKMARGAAQLGMSLEEYKAMTPWARMNLRRARGLPPLRSDASR